jgi:hypothetical protein
VTAWRRFKRCNRPITAPIIVLTASESNNDLIQAMKLGCSGIMLKQTAPELIVRKEPSTPRNWAWSSCYAFCPLRIPELPVRIRSCSRTRIWITWTAPPAKTGLAAFEASEASTSTWKDAVITDKH